MTENNQAVPNLPSEMGYTGLQLTSGRIYEDSRRELNFPQSICTYDKMSQNITIASAMNAIHTIASRAPFHVDSYDQTDTHRKRALFFEQCMNDMETTWYDFVREAMSMTKYGFSIHEKVFRYRSKDRGSKYNDMKVGIKKLPIRSQASVYKWPDLERSADGFVVQSVSHNDGTSTKSHYIDLPYSKLLHFRVDPYKGNPEGTSPLAACYQSWRMLVKLLDTELMAVGKNLNGIPHFSLPARYMSDDASDAEKSVYEATKQIGSHINNGEQAFLVTPSDKDDNGNSYFDFEVVTSTSSNISSVSPIIQRYTNEILQCLFADVLQMGSVKGGNYNVVDSKATLLELVVEARLREFCDVINNNLIPELWRLNDWDDTKTPKLTFGELSRPDLEVWAKAMQQLSATNNIAKTPRNINYIAEMMNLPDRVSEDLTKQELDDVLGVDDKMQSRSSDGMSVGKVGNGTSDNVAQQDNSANNLSNK
jgi:hypothetical protein